MKFKVNILAIILVLISTNIFSQITTFRHVFGGTGDDFGQDIEQTSDGGYIITGATGSFGYGQSDVYLLKIDSLGMYEWSRSYGGSNIDWGYDVEITTDGGYVIAGYTNSFGAGGYDFYLIRTDSIGDTLWTKTYGGWNWERCFSMDITSDNGFVMAGETYSYGAGEKDVWIVKTDEFGDTLWTKTFGGSLDDIAKSIKETFNGDLIVCGGSYTFSDGGSDGLLIKLDSFGNTEWFSSYGGIDNQEYNSIIQYYDTNGYVCFGTSFTNASESKMYLTRFDNNGTFEWEKKYGDGTVSSGSSINNRPGNSMIIIGTNANENNNIEALVISSLGSIWTVNAYLGSSEWDVGVDIILAEDNGLAILGNTKSFGNGYTDVLVYKSTSSINSDSSSYIAQLDTNTVQHPIQYTGVNTIENEDEIMLFPNPTTNNQFSVIINETIDNIQLFNMLGQTIPILVSGNESNFTVKPHAIISGIYFIKVKTNDKIICKKVIFE